MSPKNSYIIHSLQSQIQAPDQIQHPISQNKNANALAINTKSVQTQQKKQQIISKSEKA